MARTPTKSLLVKRLSTIVNASYTGKKTPINLDTSGLLFLIHDYAFKQPIGTKSTPSGRLYAYPVPVKTIRKEGGFDFSTSILSFNLRRFSAASSTFF